MRCVCVCVCLCVNVYIFRAQLSSIFGRKIKIVVPYVWPRRHYVYVVLTLMS